MSQICGYHGYRGAWRSRLTDSDRQSSANEHAPIQYLFGFELEVEQRNELSLSYDDMTDELDDIIASVEGGDGLFVYERDGSLTRGFEIVTHPMSWAWFVRNREMFERVLDALNKGGYRSHDGGHCGLHVHVNRHLSTNEHNAGNCTNSHPVILNIEYLLERFQFEILRFSRRGQDFGHYCGPLTELNINENGTLVIDRHEIDSIASHPHSRYTNLNLRNSNTIEFRFLRGTLKKETFWYSMNLIHNICLTAHDHDRVVTWDSLVYRGLSDEDKEGCKAYCESRGIIPNDDHVVVMTRTNNRLESISDDEKQRMLVELNEDD